MKPMLAATPESLADVKFPVYASPKLDGVRAIVMEGTVFARSLKELPNKNIQKAFGVPTMEDLDGELIVGNPTAKDVYRKTVSIINSKDKPIDGAVFYAFDVIDTNGTTFEDRLKAVRLRVNIALGHKIEIIGLPHVLLNNERQLRDYEEFKLGEGYEGLILRSPKGLYKFGRSTVTEGGMLKLKRFVDGEAEIVEVYEEFENQNEAVTNALGRTERSSAQAGLKAKGTAGGLTVQDCVSKKQFSIGTGFTAEQRKWFWKNRSAVVGQIVKYKHFPIGAKDLPRHPVYLGPREEWDL
jgi:DNA ligase-1